MILNILALLIILGLMAALTVGVGWIVPVIIVCILALIWAVIRLMDWIGW